MHTFQNRGGDKRDHMMMMLPWVLKCDLEHENEHTFQ